MTIDTTFDVRSDTPGSKDPDQYSATLRRYHRSLWSRQLPSGAHFTLSDQVPGKYLVHDSSLGQFVLASDSIIHTYTRWNRQPLASIVSQFPEEEKEAFRAIAYTIGGMIVFPGNKVDGKATINGARGMSGAICDRFDLTLECIRRHYLQESSPLEEALQRHATFFDLFGDFMGYVSFFLLDDLVDDRGEVQFFLPFDNFARRPTPTSVEEYVDYRLRSVEFVTARNRRIEKDAASLG